MLYFMFVRLSFLDFSYIHSYRVWNGGKNRTGASAWVVLQNGIPCSSTSAVGAIMGRGGGGGAKVMYHFSLGLIWIVVVDPNICCGFIGLCRLWKVLFYHSIFLI
jgi:hypothetical protein